MIILFLCRLFYPHFGGVEKHTYEVAKRLIKKGHLVVVLTEQLNDLNNLTKKIDGIEVVRMPQWKDNWSKKFKIWWWLWQRRSLIEKADIIHCHDVFFWYLPFRFFYPQKPVFTTFHGYETKFPPAKKAILVRKLSEKLSWGNICVGDYIKKWYGTKADYITYGGVNTHNYHITVSGNYEERTFISDLAENPGVYARDEGVKSGNKREMEFNKKNRAGGFSASDVNLPEKTPRFSAGKFIILFIGRLEKDTGLSIYLKALELLTKKGIKFVFEACGDGLLRSEAEKIGKVHGFVKDLSPYIARSNLVFSSSYLSIFEAMVNKKLVFAVYNNSLKEDYLRITPFAKWLIIENSVKALVKKIMYYLNSQSAKKKLTDEAYQWVKNQTWDEVGKIYESFYRNYSSK